MLNRDRRKCSEEVKIFGFQQVWNPRYPDQEPNVLATRPRSWKPASNYLALFMLLLLTTTDLKIKIKIIEKRNVK